MKYFEIIEPKVKQLLEKNNISFSDFKLDNCSVNIRDFIEKHTDFTIEEQPLYKKSSYFNKEENKIIVNVLEDEERKRFYMGYELGYILLDSKTTNENLDEVANLVHELLAKEFAYSFLMPERLLRKIKEKVVIEEGYSSTEITDSIKRIVIREMSEKLNVSMRLLEYKMNDIENIWN